MAYNLAGFAVIPYLVFRRRGYMPTQLNLRSSDRRGDAILIVAYAVIHVFESWAVYDTADAALLSVILLFLQCLGPGIIKAVLTQRTGNAWVHVWAYHAIAPHVTLDTVKPPGQSPAAVTPRPAGLAIGPSRVEGACPLPADEETQVRPLSSPCRTVVLLAVYRPQSHLTDLVTRLLAQMPVGTQVVVVDDGSGPGWQQHFTAVEDLGGTVLRHPANLGKGAALKTGFAHIRTAHPAADVVYADADGQHEAADIQLVSDRIRTGRIVLGVRTLDQMPLSSRLGNTITAVLFRAVTGRPLQDTQTGLRGFSAGLLDWLCTVPGEGFDYEMNMLLDATATGRPFEAVPIATRYLNGNKASNFSGVTDSVRVYRPLLRYTAATLTGGRRSRGVGGSAVTSSHRDSPSGRDGCSLGGEG